MWCNLSKMGSHPFLLCTISVKFLTLFKFGYCLYQFLFRRNIKQPDSGKVNTVITYSMLSELQDKLISENRLFTPYNIWSNYKLLDTTGNVEDLDLKQNVKALTHLIQLVRYAYKKTDKLKSLLKGYSQRFTLYCGQAQRPLTPEQQEIMKAIADYIINEGSISIMELNSIDTDLWRKAVKSFGVQSLNAEINDLSKFLLKAA